MIIRDMFKDDINRTINGVVQVEQEEQDVIKQELKEYVVTSELKKHFIKFFDSYSDSFEHPTDNVGVWITGFFGSGKSHFLKMLSYLLENKTIDGISTIEYFREKFDDELSFMNIEKSTVAPTETILFNIDVEGSINKDDTAVLRVFAKVFYEHLGFYGKDLKVAKLEQFITKQGKMDEFKRVFEEKHGSSWIESRDAMEFFEDDVTETMSEVLGMSKEAASNWFNGTETADISIGQLVEEIKEYVDSKSPNFRLLFMIDEAGQYISTNTSMLLNLQSLIEKLGSVCRGKVWIVATGQEALDDMIKMRVDEFSRIMARFKVRLSLTSSSVGEVIEKRLLTKTDTASKTLNMVYDNNASVLKNLYSFDTDVKDIKGFTTGDEFTRIFPFVPYQFILLQKIFDKVRQKGHAGKHQSRGERSMLNSFQEAAQKFRNRDELSLVPLYEFYDTLHSFLDTSVRSVFERAENAANNNNGLTMDDVNLLKLLYLINYIDDIKSNIDNITILMADKINTDKIELKKQIVESLNRLQLNNYINRNGDIYSFLTDDEQEIEREIKNTAVDTSTVVSKLAEIIFQDVYTPKKYRYQKYDFPFDEMVDSMTVGNTSGGMKLHFMTVAADPNELQELKLIMDSKNDQAICVLSDQYPYYEAMEYAEKIRKYVKQKNVNQLPDAIQRIITNKNAEASRLVRQVTEDIEKSIVEGKYYIDGEVVTLQGKDAKAKINNALGQLVERTYSSLTMIDTNVESDLEIKKILNGTNQQGLDGLEPNKEACDEVTRFLDVQYQMKFTTSMADIQSRYGKNPYGWREIDIAAVIAQLIYDQKVTIKYSGMTIQANDHRLVDLLRKKTEVGKTVISKRIGIDPTKVRSVRDLLWEYFGVMDIPSDEDGLIKFITENFGQQWIELLNMKGAYDNKTYPGRAEVNNAINLVEDVRLHSNDNTALIDKLCEIEGDLLNSKDNMENVEGFFKNQKTLFDKALDFVNDVKHESDYFDGLTDVENAVKAIKDITTVTNDFDYRRISELNNHIKTISDAREVLLTNKRVELNNIIDQCVSELQTKANESDKLSNILNKAINDFATKKDEVSRISGLAYLDAKANTLWKLRDDYLADMQNALNPTPVVTPKPNRKVKTYFKQAIFSSKNITSEQDVDAYVNEIKNKLLDLLKDSDEIKIS